MRRIALCRIGLISALTLAVVAGNPASAQTFTLKRTSAGIPDLTGHYDGGTLTPLNRPGEYGESPQPVDAGRHWQRRQ